MPKNKQPINVTNNITINFFNTSQRCTEWKIPNKRSSVGAAHSWGRAAKIMDCQKIENRKWDEIICQDVTWTHMLTINLDPKLKTFQNDPKILKQTLKSFFTSKSVLSLFTVAVFCIEVGHRGKYHAHCLIRTTHSDQLEAKMFDAFSTHKKYKDQRAAVQLNKIHNLPQQIPADKLWMGIELYTKQNHIKCMDKLPYLRKEEGNYINADIYINKNKHLHVYGPSNKTL